LYFQKTFFEFCPDNKTPFVVGLLFTNVSDVLPSSIVTIVAKDLANMAKFLLL